MSTARLLCKVLAFATPLVVGLGIQAAPRDATGDAPVGTITIARDVFFVGPDGERLAVAQGRYAVFRRNERSLLLMGTAGDGLTRVVAARPLDTGSRLSQAIAVRLDSADREKVALMVVEADGRGRYAIGGQFSIPEFRSFMSRPPSVRWSRRSLLIRSAEFQPEVVNADTATGQRWQTLGSLGEASIIASNGRLVAPVRLPDHAIADRVTAHFVDTARSTDVTLRLRCIALSTGWCGDDGPLSDALLTSTNLPSNGIKTIAIRPYVVDDAFLMNIASLEPTPAWPGLGEVAGIKAVEIDYLQLRIVWTTPRGAVLVFE